MIVEKHGLVRGLGTKSKAHAAGMENPGGLRWHCLWMLAALSLHPKLKPSTQHKDTTLHAHSARSVSAGSSRNSRSAGSRLASSATISNTAATPANVAGSVV